MYRIWKSALLCAALMVPITMAPMALQAADHKTVRTYHDKQHNDDHQWNGQEDRAYRIWERDSHRRSRDFSKLKDNDQQAYWGWRHDHSDEQLKIVIH